MPVEIEMLCRSEVRFLQSIKFNDICFKRSNMIAGCVNSYTADDGSIVRVHTKEDFISVLIKNSRELLIETTLKRELQLLLI